MKKIFLLTLISFGLFLHTESSYSQELDSAKVISVKKFEKKASHPNKNQVIDIRTPDETKEGHLEGALFVDFLADDFLEEIEKLDKNKTYLIYCRSGNRTKRAGVKMKQAGFKKVFMMEGGYTAWEKEGKPIDK